MSRINLNKLSLATLPTSEDDTFEFKSSLDNHSELKRKLDRAVSAFANSGGGYFVWGVDGKGDTDGGVEPKVGRTDLCDWIDQIVNDVSPIPAYGRKLFHDTEGRGSLDGGKAIAVVAIHPGASGPHMANDKKYYLRAGAHTEAAGHHLVEAIWARRMVAKPVLSHIIRRKPNSSFIVQLGIVALTDAPAIDVQISIAPLKGHMEIMCKNFPLQLPLIDRAKPLFMDITTTVDVLKELDDEDEIVLTVEYRDLLGNGYVYRNKAPLASGLPSVSFEDTLSKIAKSLEKIESKIPMQIPSIR